MALPMCTDVFFATDETHEMWMHTDENGAAMIGLYDPVGWHGHDRHV